MSTTLVHQIIPSEWIRLFWDKVNGPWFYLVVKISSSLGIRASWVCGNEVGGLLCFLFIKFATHRAVSGFLAQIMIFLPLFFPATQSSFGGFESSTNFRVSWRLKARTTATRVSTVRCLFFICRTYSWDRELRRGGILSNEKRQANERKRGWENCQFWLNNFYWAKCVMNIFEYPDTIMFNMYKSSKIID